MGQKPLKAALQVVERDQFNHVDIDQNLSGILEIHRDPVADDGLDPSYPPVMLGWMANPCPGHQGAHSGHGAVPSRVKIPVKTIPVKTLVEIMSII